MVQSPAVHSQSAGLDPSQVFAYAVHSGTIDDVSNLYLPAGFVHFMVSHGQAWGLILLGLCGAGLASAAVAEWRRWKSPALEWGIGGGLALAAFMTFVPFHHIPDEVFITLRQSVNLAETGRYSFYPDRYVDGSGDVLFYVLVGLLHAMGVTAPLAAIILCGLATAGTALIVFRFTLRRTNRLDAASLWAVLTIFLPSIGGLSGSGWAAPLVGCLTAGIIAAWVGGRHRLSFVLLGLLPLVRYDLVYYTVFTGALLVLVSRRAGDPDWTRHRRLYLWSLGGIPVLLASWLIAYGHLVPSCILMKAGIFVRWNLWQYHVTLFARDLWFFAGVLAVAAWRRPEAGWGPYLAWIIPGAIHIVLVLLGGGDYVPGQRYHIGFAVALAMAAAHGLPAFIEWTARPRSEVPRRGLAWFARAALAGGLFASGAAWFLYNGTMAVRDGSEVAATLPRVTTWERRGITHMVASRINNHVFTSRLFSRITQGNPAARLASLEVASIFYFFTGTAIEVQGFVNRDVATAPRHPHPVMPWDKRLDPDVWQRELPHVIWLDTANEGVPAMLNPPQDFTTDTLHRWSRHHLWTGPHLEHPYIRRNYVSRLTWVNGQYGILWFVRRDIAPMMDRRLESIGLKLVGAMVRDSR